VPLAGDGAVEDVESAARALDGGGAVLVRVATASMRPTLEPGARVLVRRGEPRVGDVVLVRGAGELTLHRLIARLGARAVHAGDADGAGGGLCRLADVIGVAELPRQVPGVRLRARLVAGALARAALRIIMAS
jgi:hypothetical protein